MKATADESAPCVDDITKHYFASGVYGREMSIPAGHVVVGKLHRTEHISVLVAGTVRITTECGSEELTAPQVIIAPPGTKRVAFAITDCRWLNFHAVGEERDLDKIEAALIAPSFDDLALDQAAVSQIGEV